MANQSTTAAPLKDAHTLIGILQFTEKLFHHLIARLPPDDKGRFAAVWQDETLPTLHQTIALLQGVTEEANPLWTALVQAGLTGQSLTLKRHYMEQAAGGGFLRKFLKFLNSLFKSLIGAIPGAEPVKELKDYLESFFDDITEPDQQLITLFGQGGFVPFGLP